jgi:predicted nucleotidyltransferase
MRFGLKEETIEKIIAVFSLFPEIDKAILYGSRAKGNYKHGSDIDITLLGNDLDLKLLNHLSLALDELLLPYKFDISIYSYINNSDLLENIKRVGIVFYCPKTD